MRDEMENCTKHGVHTENSYFYGNEIIIST